MILKHDRPVRLAFYLLTLGAIVGPSVAGVGIIFIFAHYMDGAPTISFLAPVALCSAGAGLSGMGFLFLKFMDAVFGHLPPKTKQSMPLARAAFLSCVILAICGKVWRGTGERSMHDGCKCFGCATQRNKTAQQAAQENRDLFFDDAVPREKYDFVLANGGQIKQLDQ